MLFLALRWRTLIKTQRLIQKLHSFIQRASFRNFFNNEIHLSGDWRVALSETIFPNKIQHVVNDDLIAYSLKGHEDSHKIISDANVISRPYSGEKFSFMTGSFDTVAQLLFTIKRTVGLPNFSFREIKSTGNYEILFGKNEGIFFLVKKYPVLWVLQEIQINMVYILGTKWIQLHQIN